MKNESTESKSWPVPTVTSPSHQRRWEVLMNNLELVGLQKEVLHLECKSQERTLTQWEIERLDEVRSTLATLGQGLELQ